MLNLPFSFHMQYNATNPIFMESLSFIAVLFCFKETSLSINIISILRACGRRA